MANPLQSLWPLDVEQTDVLTPKAILNFQVEELEKKSQGRLTAEIETIEGAKAFTHNLDLVAPLLNRYRYRLLFVTHGKNLVFPAAVHAALFDFDPELNDFAQVAVTQHEFADIVAKVLHSVETKSVINSLLAQSKSKEVTQADDSDQN